ncbi:MAG: diguanylate cyclase [Guyparkeria sp.]|uniref:sensor domain-containing diguanylate cyclase n=1 Tax=Guyparkeria sp. TaxID=2035736 RepID=UPI00397A5F10
MKRDARDNKISKFRHQILESIAEGVVGVDTNGRFTLLNPAACRLLGFAEEEEALGRNAPDLVHFCKPDGTRLAHSDYPYRQVLRTGLPLKGWEGLICHKDGTNVAVEVAASPLSQINGLPEGVVITLSDIGERKALEAEVARETAFSQAVIRNLPGIFYMIDGRGRFLRWNRKLEEVTGHEGHDMRNIPPTNLFPSEEQPLIQHKIEQVFHEGDTTVEANLLGPSGETTPYYFTGYRVKLDGDTYLLGVGLDISDRKAMEEELERLATHDPLSGLYNRAKLTDFLEQSRLDHERYGTPFSLIMFDIDQFKQVNDRFGHQAGDEVICELARRSKEALRKTDFLARWGGEEFLVLATHTSAQGGADLGERLRETVAETPFDQVGAVTVSVGVASYQPGETVEQLESRVDDALYRAKDMGRNRMVVAEG